VSKDAKDRSVKMPDAGQLASKVTMHVPSDTPLLAADAFIASVRRTPHAVAVRHQGRSLTYAELDRRVEQVAQALRERGVARDTLVGLCVPRDELMVAAVFGIIRAGGAYVPFDPKYPRDRVAYMVNDSGIELLIGTRELLKDFPAGDAELLYLEDLTAQGSVEGSPARGDNPAPRPGSASLIERHSGAAPDDLAYVLYTSGSTGKPKGVAVTHRSLAHLISWGRGTLTAEELAVSAATASLNFDISVAELFIPTAVGGSIRVLEDPLAIADAGHRSDLTMFNAVPSVAAELVRRHGIPPSVQTIICVGEVLSRGLAEQLLWERPGLRLINAYGPTEATVYVSGADVIAGEPGAPSIGFPFPMVRMYVLDDDLQPVPPGEWGELIIAGEWLARGYYLRPELTAEKFVPDTIRPELGQRMYRTGDLGRLLPDGRFEIAGRKDQQVKLRGFRVELTEIESALAALDQVDVAAVVPNGDHGAVHSLTAVVVSASADLDVKSIRAQLAQTLPEWMVPTHVVVTDALPTQPNGKLDRSAVKLYADSLAQADVAHRTIGRLPESPQEQQVASIMGELLEISSVGADEDFFLDLGGTSLQGVRLLTEIWRVTGVWLPMSLLLEDTTAARLGEALSADGALEQQPVVVLQPGDGNGKTIYLFSGWFGQTLGYRRLLRHLDMPSLRVVSICPQPLADGSFATNMTELAERSYRLLRQDQPSGPYWIGGHSMGGMLAHEIAGRLVEEGIDVWPVISIDPHARAVGPRAIVDEFGHLATELFKGSKAQRAATLALLVQRLRRRRAKNAQNALQADVEDRTASLRSQMRSGTEGVLDKLEATDQANFAAIESWAPSRSRAQMILIATSEWSGYRGRPDLGWRPYLRRGRLKVLTLKAGHGQVMQEPEVALLADILRPEMLAIQRRATGKG
jgi:amino acid adenylation domain-containing protein